MTVPKKVSQDLLLDSEASLRIADNMLGELRDSRPADYQPVDLEARILAQLEDPALLGTALPRILLKAYREITSMLDSLRRSRAIIEQATIDRLSHTSEKLREVSSATEVAATDMLDGLDRALNLIDRLETIPAGDEAETVRRDLRDEVFRVITCLQFQDITAQQISYASSVLSDLEDRILAIAKLIDESVPGLSAEESAAAAVNGSGNGATFDPAASTKDAETRQAVADEIFTTPA